MESLWMLAGIVLGGGVGYLLGASSRAPARGKSEGRDTDIAALRTEWKDTLDRIEHLYDRVRKRVEVARVEATPTNGAPVYRTGAEVLMEARRRGLTK